MDLFSSADTSDEEEEGEQVIGPDRVLLSGMIDYRSPASDWVAAAPEGEGTHAWAPCHPYRTRLRDRQRHAASPSVDPALASPVLHELPTAWPLHSMLLPPRSRAFAFSCESRHGGAAAA